MRPEGFHDQHSAIAQVLRAARSEALQDFADWLAAEAGRSGHYILSGEALSRLHRDEVVRFAGLLPDAAPRIVLYVRNLYDWGLSNFLQQQRSQVNLPQLATLKLHGSLGFRFARFSPSATIAMWEDVFGADRVAVRAMDQRPAGRDLIDDFLATCGIAAGGLKKPERPANVAMDPVTSVFFNHIAYASGARPIEFYRAYQEAFARPPRFERLRSALFDLLDAWAAAVDLSHPKLAPYAEGLRRRPPLDTEPDFAEAQDYLGRLAGVIQAWHGRMRR